MSMSRALERSSGVLKDLKDIGVLEVIALDSFPDYSPRQYKDQS